MSEEQSYSAAAEVGQVRLRRTRWQRFVIEAKKAPPTAVFGFIIIAIYAVVAIFAPVIAPYGEADTSFSAYQSWGEGHIFGTDQIGRDVFSRLIYGARNTVGIALVTTLLAFAIGGGLGLMAAISQNWLDQVLSRAIDVLMAIPGLIFALVLISIASANEWPTMLSLIIIIAVLDSTRVFRLTRAVSLNVVVMDYVEAAKLRGEKLPWIMRREILPNILPPLVAEFGLRFCFVFLMIAALSFLGVGIQPPTADWGSMVRDGASFISYIRPWNGDLAFSMNWSNFMEDMKLAAVPLLPAGAIALLTIAVNFVVDWFLHKTSGLKDEH